MISNILAPIFVFAIIVFVHEGGHFLMAKWTGMRIIEFSIGFGPLVWSAKHGDTLYSIRLIPLGGYNKIAGMDDKNRDDPKAFNQKPVWAKFLVIVGGVVFNILLAFCIFLSVFKIEGYQTFPNLPIVGAVLEGTSAASQHLEKGDRIISIDGKSMEKWTDIGEMLRDRGNRITKVEVEHQGEIRQVTIIPKDMGDGRPIMGISPYMEHHDTTLSEAVSMSINRCTFLLKMMGDGLYGMLSGGEAEVSGPIGVARMSAQVADHGLVSLFLFIALLSLNLGFLNILPVPLLDGGHLVLILLEAILGRELPPKALMYIQVVGVSILAAIFIFAMANDITDLLK